MGYSDSINKRYRGDIQMDSLYNRKKHRKKNIKPNTSITQSHSQTSNENIKTNKILKRIKRTI